ncbi:hypothetical protein PF004_g21262 [Phytophthora fragariae]|uniref:RxLR effector protein n=1 Tax=Phytophthora fragariae TaxID=53985 RepID=A0A6G0N4G1_9STRA|nr:hypothetical protein PF003_g24218 [Phytophthora fragariae]KAE9192596.1 hypothetical protein PF004_g21262 [Phytophthora fragariae]
MASLVLLLLFSPSLEPFPRATRRTLRRLSVAPPPSTWLDCRSLVESGGPGLGWAGSAAAEEGE